MLVDLRPSHTSETKVLVLSVGRLALVSFRAAVTSSRGRKPPQSANHLEHEDFAQQAISSKSRLKRLHAFGL